MQRSGPNHASRPTRRDFLGASLAVVSTPLVSAALAAPGRAEAETATPATLAFAADGKEYCFDTGALRGVLRAQGKSLGLAPLVDAASGTTIARAYGACSHYRLLDADARYGSAAWDWASQSRLAPDGSVEVNWSADNDHPFDMTAAYRWTAPNTLDVVTAVVARKALRGFEVFLASYFAGFASSLVYVQGCPETGGRPGLLEAKKSYAVWQMFPRDDAAVALIQDGRWKRPPNPVEWRIMPRLAGPLAVRREAKTGLVALLMAPPGDCFAVATPYSEEAHYSIYLSLFGRDLTAGQTATARSRLVVARGISDPQAVALYEAYAKEAQAGGKR